VSACTQAAEDLRRITLDTPKLKQIALTSNALAGASGQSHCGDHPRTGGSYHEATGTIITFVCYGGKLVAALGLLVYGHWQGLGPSMHLWANNLSSLGPP